MALIKPELFLNEKLSDLAWPVRYFYVALYSLADSDYQIKDTTPKALKARLLPYDDGSALSFLTELETGGFLTINEGVITLTGVAKKSRGGRKKTPELTEQLGEF